MISNVLAGYRLAADHLRQLPAVLLPVVAAALLSLALLDLTLRRPLPWSALRRNATMPGMSVKIRPIRRLDVPGLAGLLGQLGYPATEAAVQERLDYWLDDHASRLLGADDGGDLIGVAALGVLPMLEVTGRLGRLLALVVDERYRGRGVGQSLVAAAEAQARAAGCVKMEVTSSRYRTRTHEFYQQLGYEDICPSSARFVKGLAG